MKTYTYIRYSTGKTLEVVVALSISHADKIFERRTGINPWSNSDVAVKIKANE
jgi:hypothetical protein|tara:strand:- start:706 stop:864 length:159 start_codon:yes stop_codon:yes gene_type:complete